MKSIDDKDFIEAIDNLADMILEGAKENYKSDLESFEQYSEKVKQEIRENLSAVRDRFVRGQEILMREINKKRKEESEDE